LSDPGQVTIFLQLKTVRSYGKNGFAEVSKNLDTDLKIILLDHQNNYV